MLPAAEFSRRSGFALQTPLAQFVVSTTEPASPGHASCQALVRHLQECFASGSAVLPDSLRCAPPNMGLDATCRAG